MLFFLGNGCSKHLITEWILTSQHWTTLQKESRKQDKQTLLITTCTLKLTFGSIMMFIIPLGYFSMENSEIPIIYKDHILSRTKNAVFFSLFFPFFPLSLSITRRYSVFHILFVILTTMFTALNHLKLRFWLFLNAEFD